MLFAVRPIMGKKHMVIGRKKESLRLQTKIKFKMKQRFAVQTCIRYTTQPAANPLSPNAGTHPQKKGAWISNGRRNFDFSFGPDYYFQ